MSKAQDDPNGYFQQIHNTKSLSTHKLAFWKLGTKCHLICRHSTNDKWWKKLWKLKLESCWTFL